MVSISHAPVYVTRRRIKRIQAITIGWMLIEAVVSISAATLASSPALLAFGGDSAIELLSAVVVLWRFRHTERPSSERLAARITGALLFALAAYVAVVSVLALFGHAAEPKPSYAGIVVLVAAAIIMPWLAREKRKLSAITNSAALRADAAQSGLCAYLSLIALAGIVVNVFFHAAWADPLAALVILPIVVWEGKESFRGRSCGCC